MTVTLVRLGDQRFFIALRDVPLGCHLGRRCRPGRGLRPRRQPAGLAVGSSHDLPVHRGAG